MNIKEALEYIHSVKWQGSKPGLSRTRELLASLGNPEKSLKFVHVAGTNGKGSTCACIASVLRNAGYTTGLYVSPYILHFNERIQVDGKPITNDELAELVVEIRPCADAMDDPPTEFEIITALAMKHFLNYACDIVVLEVGMGGELDSTNVIDTPELAVITAIDYDHTEQLGPTLANIARAKAGIIKEGGNALMYGGSPDVENVLRGVAAERGAKLRKAVFERITKAANALDKTRLVVEPYEEILLPLAGTYQPYNALVSITALEMLREQGYKINAENIAEGLSNVSITGRFEFLGYDPVFIMDGAHNPQGAKAVADSLRAYFKNHKFVFVMGVLADKDVGAMIGEIAPIAEHVFTVSPNSPRKMDAKCLAGMFAQKGVEATPCGSISEGVEQAVELAEDIGKSGSGAKAVVCAVGSLYISADVKNAYERLT